MRVGALALCVLGLCVLGYALLVPAKAILGQELLARAFEQAKLQVTTAAATQTEPALADPSLVKPWPWADIAPVARLDFPTLGKSRLVLNQASGEAMAWGPGHVTGTQPLGQPGLSAAAAHRDTHFALLADLGPGDPIELETLDGARADYRVISARVVDARDWRFPIVTEGPDVLALSTCWPLDEIEPGPERLILFAARVAPEAAASRSANPNES